MLFETNYPDVEIIGGGGITCWKDVEKYEMGCKSYSNIYSLFQSIEIS